MWCTYMEHQLKIKEIMEICNKHNVPVLEDAAESLGATVDGKQNTGTLENMVYIHLMVTRL